MGGFDGMIRLLLLFIAQEELPVRKRTSRQQPRRWKKWYFISENLRGSGHILLTVYYNHM